MKTEIPLKFHIRHNVADCTKFHYIYCVKFYQFFLDNPKLQKSSIYFSKDLKSLMSCFHYSIIAGLCTPLAMPVLFNRKEKCESESESERVSE